MNLHPFDQVVGNAEGKIRQGWTVFQQFLCGHCGVKQTMSEPNHFYTEGICEACGGVTDILTDGCNFMGVWEGKRGKGRTVGDVLSEVIKGGEDDGE